MIALLNSGQALHTVPSVAEAKDQYRRSFAHAVRIMMSEADMQDFAQQHANAIKLRPSDAQEAN